MSANQGSQGPSVVIEQAPGWWTSQVIVRCQGCGWTLRVDLNDAPHGYAEREAQRHECEPPRGSTHE